MSEPASEQNQYQLAFSRWWPLCVGALTGLTMRLLFSGKGSEAYAAMMASFVLLVPVLVGAVAAYVAERLHRRTWTYYFWAGAWANLFAVVGALVIMVEGLICAIVIVPLVSVYGGLGGLLMGAICRWTSKEKPTLLGITALPLVLGAFEQTVPLPDAVRVVERVTVIAAPPQRIWAVLEDARDIEPYEVDRAWMYRIGVPLPIAGITRRTASGVVRDVTMGRGIRFQQVATLWEPGQRVKWTYRFTPESFPPGALDDHVMIGGRYFDIIDTDYALTGRADGTTELRSRMRYRVSTQFNWYVDPIAQFLVGNFQEVILEFYARRAERSVQ
jgi:hypothetical protein